MAAAATYITTADISGLVSRIVSLERMLTNYIYTESVIQESKNTQRILNKFHTFMPTVLAKATDLKLVYNATGELLTDLDGCIIISAKPPKPVARNGYKNNTLGFNPASDFAKTIIVESKHSLTKAKIDTKILQMCKLKELFEALPALDFDDTAPVFQTMIEEYGFHRYPVDFYIIFAADDMDYDIRKFLIALSEGISKDAYNSFTMLFFKNDPLYKTIKKNASIPKKLKNALHATKTIEDALTVLDNIAFREYTATFSRILVPYDTIVSQYDRLRNRIGFLQFNTLYLPELFPYPMQGNLFGSFSSF